MSILIHRIIVFLFFLSIITCSVFGQELEVKSFKKDLMDIAAQENPVLDFNDNPCALIKVLTPLSGLVFDSNRGIQKTEYKTGEYWVYLPSAASQLKVAKEGFMKLLFPIPLSLESSTVFIMELIPKMDMQVVNTKDKGYFKVITEPPGAKITMEGNPSFEETSPYDATKKKHSWPVGNKLLMISLDEYYVKDTLIAVEKDTTTNLNISLTPKFSFLKFGISPENAELFINDKLITDKNETQKLIKGKVKVEIKAPHFYSDIKNMDVPDGGTTQYIEIKLKPIMGTLSVEAGNDQTSGADVYVNDENIGKVPIKEYKLQEGNYKLRIEKAGLVKLSKDFSIKENSDTKLTENLSNLVSVLIVCDPVGADFSINGTPMGSTPKTVPIKLGTNTIELSKSQFLPKKETFTILESSKKFQFRLLPDQFLDAKKDYTLNSIGYYSSMVVVVGGLAITGYETYNIISKYNEYKTATTEATQLHIDIISGRNFLFASLGTAVVAYIPYKIFKKNHRSLKKRYNSFACIPTENGVLLTMKINF